MHLIYLFYLLRLMLFHSQEKPAAPPPVVQADSLVHISITAVGDLMCHSSQYVYSTEADGSYNFSPSFGPVSEYLAAADLTVGNLETVLSGDTRDFSGYPAFNTPNQYADALKAAGFDALFTSNNHSFDRREAGVLRTIQQLQSRQLPYIGTFTSQADRDSIRIIPVKGIKIALLGYTQFSNIGVPAEKKYLINHIDTLLISRDIARARALGAELVLINYHWGEEYKKEPNAYQRLIAEFTMRAGADIILGEHPHVLQPAQLFASRGSQKLDSGVIAYSLGNFYSSQQWRYSDAGTMFSIDLTKNTKTGKIHISGLRFVPTWVFKGQAGSRKRFFIFPSAAGELSADSLYIKRGLIAAEFQYLYPQHLYKMKQANEDSRYILSLYRAPLREVFWKKDMVLQPLRPRWQLKEMTVPAPVLPVPTQKK